ncbi:MAG: RES family NAD+ phosphorylase [Bacillota bacterium]
MNCCVKCFRDTEIKAIINGLNIKGNCDFCGKRDTYIYEIETNKIITELFDGLLDIYTPVSNLPDTFPKKSLDLLKNILHNKWSIFNLEPDCIYKLITYICSEKYKERPELFDGPVGILETIQEDYLEKYSLLRTFQWDDFVNEIKCKNRFHTNYINKDVLKLFLGYARKSYKAGAVFYRARICQNENGFDSTEMGAPPTNLATAGRANPEGISCLYLSNSEKTTLHEIRAGIYDYVTIAEFTLLKDIEVVNLAEIDKISPFLGIDYTQLAINIDHLKKISNEIAKPLRRHDSTLDYLPTQYVSDYIKHLNYDGIEYISTMCVYRIIRTAIPEASGH